MKLPYQLLKKDFPTKGIFVEKVVLGKGNPEKLTPRERLGWEIDLHCLDKLFSNKREAKCYIHDLHDPDATHMSNEWKVMSYDRQKSNNFGPGDGRRLSHIKPDTHERFVRRAYELKLLIPQEVLDEYPELTKT